MQYRIQLYRRDTSDEWISITSLDYHPEFLERLTYLGLITIKDEKIHNRDLIRLEKLLHLRTCLGVNLVGASIILDLLDRVEELQQEIRHYKP